jgi:LacI family transcriptional regulator
MKATINDVAKIAGVSKATVSRVLNGSKPVSEDIRNKVMKVVQETNYKPSSLARSLVSKKTNIFGIIIPDVSNPFFSELVKGVQMTANENGYNILLCNTYDEFDKEMEYLNILDDKEVDGIIFLTSKIEEKHKEFFSSYKNPTVTVSRRFEDMPISSVDIDNFSAAYEVMNYLINLNHKKIAMIRGPLYDKSTGYDRYKGYEKALEDSNINLDENLVVEGKFKVKDGYNAMSKLLTLKELPTAVFCACDEMAIGAIKCIYESGFKVPEDISVVGFDDIPIASMFIPSVTTVRQPVFDFGEKAVDILLRQIKSGVHEEENIVLPTKIIIRKSTIRK